MALGHEKGEAHRTEALAAPTDSTNGLNSLPRRFPTQAYGVGARGAIA
ncbi:MAG: hypothetical protein PHO08_00905 [Methylococcales bacterium]|nr:hypothetical protein [Methylococcales bacterium]